MLLWIGEIINAMPKHTLIVGGSPGSAGYFCGSVFFLLKLQTESGVITSSP